MLILSRQVGQSIVIDDQIVVTVVRFTPNDVELSLQNTRGVLLESVTVFLEDSAELLREVNVTMIKAGENRVRLGFSYGDVSTYICRKEIWDDLHPTR